MIFIKQGKFEYYCLSVKRGEGGTWGMYCIRLQIKNTYVCMYGEGKIPSPYTHTLDRPPKKVIQSDLLQTYKYIQQIFIPNLRLRPIIII